MVLPLKWTWTPILQQMFFAALLKPFFLGYHHMNAAMVTAVVVVLGLGDAIFVVVVNLESI